MMDVKITRRAFTALAAGGLLVSALPGCGVDLGLEKTEVRALLRIARLLFPHAHLSGDVYDEVLQPLQDSAVANNNFSKEIRLGLDELDKVIGGEWLTATEELQIDALKKIANGAFFGTVLNNVRPRLYQHVEVWNLIGYEGSSVEYGGYINRGFDDIDWLPED